MQTMRDMASATQAVLRVRSPPKAIAVAVVLGALFFASGSAVAEPPRLQYRQLPTDLRSYADKIHRSCKELDNDAQPNDLMQGIEVIDLEGTGSQDLLVDAELLCNSWIKGGNCSNRGCDLKIWKQVNARSWRLVFDEHLSRKFISRTEKGRLKLMALSIYGGNSNCKADEGRECDALVRYRNGNWVWEKIQ